MYHQPSASAGAEQQYHQFSASTSYGYTPMSANMPGIIAPQYQSSPRHLSPRPMQNSPLHRRHASTGSQGLGRAGSRSLSPGLGTPGRSTPFTPMDRSLPSKSATSETITDAYVAFILYCNPNYPLDVDTQALRSHFQSPPRSDNKDFEIFRLFELLQKLESKEIKTWGKLALDLGVEAPTEGQSNQKVQQYTVRLKRWMHAMHVDAFFEYLMGKEHSYFTEIPHPNDPYPAEGRDGVVVEEDLAIRDLDPSFRPKRGRRRNDDVEQEADAESAVTNKGLRMSDGTFHNLTVSPHPMSVGPWSANPYTERDPWAVASAVTPQDFVQWPNKGGASQSAATPAAASQLRWQIHDSSQDPSTPHPLTAHPSSANDNMDSSFDNEPKSAVTPSTRKRRRHGPAVSSAWPSANGPNAKPRGRPPASRNVQDGPFSTFPADPTNNKAVSQPYAAPAAMMNQSGVNEEQAVPSAPTPTTKLSDGTGRPGRLSLQVPPHTGGPVRLATPPRVLVNGETNDSEENPLRATEVGSQGLPPSGVEKQRAVLTVERDLPGFAFEALKRVLTSDLLRADIVGRRYRLTGDEAKRLADAVLERFNLPRADTNNARDDIARLTAASWLGLGEHLNVPLGPATGPRKRIMVTRFQTDSQGYEVVVPLEDEDADDVWESFDIAWTINMGGCSGNFELKDLTLHDAVPKQSDIHDQVVETWYRTAQQIGMEPGKANELGKTMKGATLGGPGSVGDDGIDWKSKYRALEFGTKMARGEFDRFRERVIEKLLDAVV